MAIDFSALFKRAGKAAAENSPVILTALAVTGTLSTAYLAAKGAFKSAQDLDTEYHKPERNEKPIEVREAFDLTWKNYIPAAASAAMTVVAIVGIKAAGERSAAAMAMAYKASENAYKQYREAATEKVGKAKETAVHEAAMQKHLEKHPPESTTVLYTGKGGTLIFDTWNGRYFDHDPELIRRAVNDFNQKVIHETSATLNDFWDLLEVERTNGSEYVGWDTDEFLELDYVYHTVNGNPCLAIDFRTRPKALYSTTYR